MNAMLFSSRVNTYVSASLQNLHVVVSGEHPRQAFPTYCPLSLNAEKKKDGDSLIWAYSRRHDDINLYLYKLGFFKESAFKLNRGFVVKFTMEDKRQFLAWHNSQNLFIVWRSRTSTDLTLCSSWLCLRCWYLSCAWASKSVWYSRLLSFFCLLIFKTWSKKTWNKKGILSCIPQESVATRKDRSQGLAPRTVHTKRSEQQVEGTSPKNSNQFEFTGLVAGNKYKSLRRDIVEKLLVHTMGLVSATSCRDKSQRLVSSCVPTWTYC